MSKRKSIWVWNRKSNRMDQEFVYGDRFIQFLYKTNIGLFIEHFLSQKKLFSAWYGGTQSKSTSKNKIKPFIEKFNVDMTPYEDTSYNSFNEFFIRKFKSDARPLNNSKDNLSAFAEARYFGWQSLNFDQKFPIKGSSLAAPTLLGGLDKAKHFIGGPVLLARLCPVDYHRYHYPCDGITDSHFEIHGNFHSVNPAAIQSIPEVFLKNERRVSLLNSKQFGKLAFVEVGALCVGKIVQTHDESLPFKKGQEKGYFLFGGSTIILFGEPGKFKISEDILQNSQQGIETLIQLNDAIAHI